MVLLVGCVANQPAYTPDQTEYSPLPEQEETA